MNAQRSKRPHAAIENAAARDEAARKMAQALAAERSLSDALAEALRNVDILLEGRGTADANDLPLGSSAGCAPLGEWIAHTLSRYDAARGAK